MSCTEPRDPMRNTEAARQPAPPARISSRELLRDRRELLIEHGTECYRLRETRNGKLILTK